MTSCMASLGGCMASVMLLAGRLVLFLACLLLAINQFSQLVPHKNDIRPETSVTTPEKNPYIGYVALGFLLSISMLGLLGAITRDSRHLKMFALLVTVLALLDGFSVYGRYMERDYSEEQFKSVLKNAEKGYTWYQTDANPQTTLWDTVQESFQCCGLKTRSEWSDTRPAYLDDDVMPGSCCKIESRAHSPDGRCHHKDAFKSGCEMEYHHRLNHLINFYSVKALFYLALALLAFGVAKPRNGPSRQVMSQYSRFEGSVYVRRPEYDAGPYYNQKPPAYVAANAPPPSYGLS